MAIETTSLPSRMPAEPKNIAGVPKKKWQTWSPAARAVFNAVFAATSDQRLIQHPKAPRLPVDQWKTTRWNMAWLAADASDGRL